MKEILLSKHGKHRGKYVALVDDGDFDRANKHDWHVNIRITKGVKYVTVSRSCYYKDGTRVRQKLETFIMGNPGKGFVHDHKDRNPLNNQRDNLRKCTPKENDKNRGSRSNTSSIYKGVSWKVNDKKWLSRICCDGKCTFIGYFIDETEAAVAYDKKAIELHGEFAYLNFPQIKTPDNKCYQQVLDFGI